ncbi:MAG: BMP family ABC transporter substrate-binding protein [Deltaproteobacteria bacterium]|nr:BMP family ABC transporter substrate-binding protein [Deltaproteobacteria bacterium]MBW1935634.1 BMP family ABC transporter substrate-binding protein [Deltaproteobacteria bacterium]MBW1977981.1 BMP family ABC transporter substrate-binding protein [Deltaproteobacteria bacterium]MBW2045247.1 BMP family ABC transporter substrate-binding protein [Deltaproteobacteria bacterium]MBW2301349.1 BMP family ABC transporter substrate-binding protein [Deltaproteobacteria bacterium]
MAKRLVLLLVVLLSVGLVFSAPCFAKMKVAFALLWTIDDMGWTTAHYRGIQYLKKELGDKVEVSYTEKVLAANAEQVLRGYAKAGYKIIFATTFEHMDPCLIVARDFPNVIFEHCSGYKKNDTNMGNYFVRMYQAEYLAGYMAGLMGYKNVGTVATQPIPEPIRGINAFTIGLKKGLKEAHVPYNPQKVNTVVWLKSWRDATNETLLAETLASRGHDLIRQMADTPDSSIAACRKGVPAVGYGIDVSAQAPCALVSTEWNWGVYYVDTVKRVLAGTWKPAADWWGFDKKGIKLSPFNASVPEKVRKKVLAEKAFLEKGIDNIFAGPIKDQSGRIRIPEGRKASDQDLLTMRWLVQGVSGKIPD